MKNAIVLTDGLLMTSDAKTAHGLIRGTERFNIIGLVDGEANAGKDAGILLDGQHRGIPVFATMERAIATLEKVDYLIIFQLMWCHLNSHHQVDMGMAQGIRSSHSQHRLQYRFQTKFQARRGAMPNTTSSALVVWSFCGK